MTGNVDKDGRAILRIRLQHPTSGAQFELDAWIDTGFTGDLVVPMQHLSALGLPLRSRVQAVLGDGSVVELDNYACLLDWSGQWRSIEIVANQGQFPLLGVGLLMDRQLHIDYPNRTLSLI